jgi:two-component system, cell cycle sensor histidine kinase and response regulator CckA
MAIPNSYDILQAVIDATPDAIFVKDLDGRYVLVNDAFARFIGKSPSEIVGRNDFQLYPEVDARAFVEADRQVLDTGIAQAFEGEATGEAGPQTYHVTKGVYRDKDGCKLGVYGISHDISELKHAHETLEQTREALFRSQKMEAVGQLTGGIAHDFNNILAIILGNAELLKATLPQNPAVHDTLDAIIRATLHGKDLTGHLLAFSRRRLLNPQPVDVDDVVTGVVRLLGRTLGAMIDVTTSSRQAGMAFADPAALEAAVLNIALNARDAMPDGGILAIRTSAVTIADAPRTDDDLALGSYALIEVEDTGCGMPPDVVARVFEPFFTTKSSGRGTGLGLSMVYGFAKQSGGTVMIVSEVGRGTTVRMFLPLATYEPQSVETHAEPLDAPSVARTILLVEDEADVRHIVRRQLEGLGHRVLMAEAATEALLLLQGPGAPELLMTDIVLPTGMNGVDLAEAARALRPGLPVIFMSGYSSVPAAQQRIREMGAPLLSKPFTTPQLERAVKRAG